MNLQRLWTAALGVLVLGSGFGLGVWSGGSSKAAPQKKTTPDAAAEFVQQKEVPATRPEQKLSTHDRSGAFDPDKALPSSPALQLQPEKGEFPGFDFARDPLDAKYPKQSPDEIRKADVAMKPKVMAMQRKWLEGRFDLKPKLDPVAKMSRGKPLPVGPTARLAKGMTWEKLGQMSATDIRAADAFPYPSLPHPKHTPGGMVLPQAVTAMFPRLERFDVDFDLPEAFLPEFPSAMFLQNRPELGDVSRGQVVSLNNYYELFKGILTPVQLDGLRLLLTPLPQEEFNQTDDRKTTQASPGIACLDCHTKGTPTGPSS